MPFGPVGRRLGLAGSSCCARYDYVVFLVGRPSPSSACQPCPRQKRNNFHFGHRFSVGLRRAQKFRSRRYGRRFYGPLRNLKPSAGRLSKTVLSYNYNWLCDSLGTLRGTWHFKELLCKSLFNIKIEYLNWFGKQNWPPLGLSSNPKSQPKSTQRDCICELCFV